MVFLRFKTSVNQLLFHEFSKTVSLQVSRDNLVVNDVEAVSIQFFEVDVLEAKTMALDDFVRNPMDVIMLSFQRKDVDGAVEHLGDLQIRLQFPIAAERVSYNDRHFGTVPTSTDHLSLVPGMGNSKEVLVKMIVVLVDHVQKELVRLENESVVASTDVISESGLAGTRSASDDDEGNVRHDYLFGW